MNQINVGKYLVRIVNRGDRYGLNDCLTHLEDKPLVEFWDTRYKHTPRGQFVSRYYVNTLLNFPRYHALDLMGGVEGWTLTTTEVDQVRRFLIRCVEPTFSGV